MSMQRPLDTPVTEDDIETLYQLILKRNVGNDEYKKSVVDSGVTLRLLIRDLRESVEALMLVEREAARFRARFDVGNLIPPTPYRAPNNFALTAATPKRIIVVGSCLSQSLIGQIGLTDNPCETEFYFFGNELAKTPQFDFSDYDFQLIQPPLRYVLPDFAFARLSQFDEEAHEQLMEHAKNSLKALMENALRWNKSDGLLTFVVPFLVPQQNLVGKLMPRYKITNPVFFIEEINRYLSDLIDTKYSNCYFFDINEVVSSFGRKFFCEDMSMAFNHGSAVIDFDHGADQSRLEPVAPATRLYSTQTEKINQAVWDEICSLYRTVRGHDAVKLVVIDLDDTLWRGVIADVGPDGMPTSEGWPKGFWEALLFLKRRGILLAIISKNEETVVRNGWKSIPQLPLSFEDFAVVKINWDLKSNNMQEIIKSVNLLPRSIVYIDDNPVQRSEIKSAFPDIRVLGGNPLTWRHILLWAPETQVSVITAESAARTEMVRAQVSREEERREMSTADFLRGLEVSMKLFAVQSDTHSRFPRVLELINKTNQFNTTGRRWTHEEACQAFRSGTVFYAFELTDRYTDYGLVGVLILDDVGIRQFVMSCRIMGLEAEIAAVSKLVELYRRQHGASIFADMVETPKNLPCREVYLRCGFQKVANGWAFVADEIPSLPPHIRLIAPELEMETGPALSA